MNWSQFQKNVGTLVQIEPPVCCLDSNGHVLPERRDSWLIHRLASDSVAIKNQSTDHVAELGKDHIFDFRSNPSCSKDGVKHGFLVLKMQIFIQGRDLWLRPNAKPGERVPHSAQPHHKQLWTPFIRVNAESSVPAIAPFATIQYRLWSEDDDVPLLLRIAADQNGAFMQELSGPSGVVEQMLTQHQMFYVSFSHPKVRYQISVLGYRLE